MNTANCNTRRARRRARNEQGWVLLSSLVLSSLLAALTITWARHAVQAKKTLEIESGASEAEEVTTSGFARVRTMMRNSEVPGGCDTGNEDIVTTPVGGVVISEIHALDHDLREVWVVAKEDMDSSTEAMLHALAVVVPGNGSLGDTRTKLQSDTCTDAFTAGAVTTVMSDTTLTGNVSGVYMVQDGVTLTLDDCRFEGVIASTYGLSSATFPATGADRPALVIAGDSTISSGANVPGTAIVMPDGIVEAPSSARFEIDGFVVGEELLLDGRGTVRGMMVSGGVESIGSDVVRPGFGRGPQTWPEDVVAGAERVMTIAFPHEDPSNETLDTMEGFDIGGSED